MNNILVNKSMAPGTHLKQIWQDFQNYRALVFLPLEYFVVCTFHSSFRKLIEIRSFF